MKNMKRCKCVVIGDAAVGKTAIVKSLIGKPHAFPSTYTMTPGVEIFRKSMRQPNSDRVLEFFIYDFSGKSIYADLVRQIWSNNVSVIVGVFDVSREESLFALQASLSELLKQIERPDDVVGIILGNKVDLSQRRCVSAQDAQQLAKKYRMRYFDVSAKEDAAAIEQSFFHLTNVWLDQHRCSGAGSSAAAGQQAVKRRKSLTTSAAAAATAADAAHTPNQAVITSS